MAADFGLVTDATERHAHELAVGRLGNRLPSDVLPTPRRANQAENRRFHLVYPLLHGKVFDNAFLDLLQSEMIGIEHLLGRTRILADAGFLAPGQADQGSDEVAVDRKDICRASITRGNRKYRFKQIYKRSLFNDEYLTILMLPNHTIC